MLASRNGPSHPYCASSGRTAGQTAGQRDPFPLPLQPELPHAAAWALCCKLLAVSPWGGLRTTTCSTAHVPVCKGMLPAADAVPGPPPCARRGAATPSGNPVRISRRTMRPRARASKTCCPGLQWAFLAAVLSFCYNFNASNYLWAPPWACRVSRAGVTFPCARWPAGKCGATPLIVAHRCTCHARLPAHIAPTLASERWTLWSGLKHWAAWWLGCQLLNCVPMPDFDMHGLLHAPSRPAVRQCTHSGNLAFKAASVRTWGADDTRLHGRNFSRSSPGELCLCQC